MKILHLNTVRKLSAGQRRQLEYEETASKQLENVSWEIMAFQVYEPKNTFEKQCPRFFRLLFIRNLYFWIYLILKRKEYDIILMRYLPFDPFILIFGWFVRNRISIHHSKSLKQLKIMAGWKGKAASLLERVAGFFNALQVLGIIGVTEEIAQDQLNSNRAKCPIGFYPNGIDFDKVEPLTDKREETNINIAFMCGRFTPWHGLDRLIEAAKEYSANLIPDICITVHLIGELDSEQINSIKQLNMKNIIFLCHGYLETNQYRAILDKCDIGIDSLSLDKKKLTEATALKVREYLALGLPVYSAFKDAALPQHFPFYCKGPISFNHIRTYAREMKNVPRSQVRHESVLYIRKYDIMLKLCEWLKQNFQ